MGGGKSSKSTTREARLARNLRANLARRKAQQRGRSEDAPVTDEPGVAKADPTNTGKKDEA